MLLHKSSATAEDCGGERDRLWGPLRGPVSLTHPRFFLQIRASVLALLTRSMQGSCASWKCIHLDCGWDATDELDLFFTEIFAMLDWDILLLRETFVSTGWGSKAKANTSSTHQNGSCLT